MQNSPLQLEEYHLRELEFALATDLNDIPSRSARYDSLNIDVNTKVDMLHNDLRRWRCELTVESKNKEELNHPYRFRITYVGFFRVVEEYPSNLVERMVRANAPALLYSAAREALLPLTSRGRYPAIVLPSVTFIEPLEVETAEGKALKGNLKRSSRKAMSRKVAKR